MVAAPQAHVDDLDTEVARLARLWSSRPAEQTQAFVPAVEGLLSQLARQHEVASGLPGCPFACPTSEVLLTALRVVIFDARRAGVSVGAIAGTVASLRHRIAQA